MKKNRMPVMILFIGIITTIIGFSYAFFMYGKTGLYTHTINGGKIGVIYNEITGNNITIDNAYPLTDSEALTRSLEFEFTITGYNESDKNVYYQIEMDHGSDVNGKNRFLDSDMKLTLYENDELVYKNEIFNNLDNQAIHYGYINYGTSSTNPITNTYLLKIWINDDVFITSTPDYFNTEGKNIYSTSDFANSYANFKVNVIADLTYDEIGYLTYDANGGEFTPEKTSLTTGKVTTQKPVMENKGFLGWSSDQNATSPEYLAGDIYTDNEQVLYAVYSEKKNVMSDLSSFSSYRDNIYEVYFMNISQEQTDAYVPVVLNNGGIVVDLTHEDYVDNGRVLGILENNCLYVVSEGTTYLTTGYKLFDEYSSTRIFEFVNADTSMVINMTKMFSIGHQIMTSNELNDFNIKQLNYVKNDNNVKRIESAALEVNLDLSGFNTANVMYMNNMFEYFHGLLSVNLKNFDTSNVIDMTEMFYRCWGLSRLDLSNFDTSNVEDMSSMFESCHYLTDLNISHFNTQNVVSMNNMFQGCESLLVLDVSKFNTSNVTDMSYMFDECSSLTKLDVKNFNTKNVMDMLNMFTGCCDLKILDVSNFDTSNVENMSGIFAGCNSVTELNISRFNTSKVTDMSDMFGNCSSLTRLDVSNFDTCNVRRMISMFSNCSGLKELDLTSFDMSNVRDVYYMFSNCSNLTTIYCNDDWNSGNITSSMYMFDYCYNLIGAILYSSSKIDITAANPDTGYFTRKMHR